MVAATQKTSSGRASCSPFVSILLFLFISPPGSALLTANVKNGQEFVVSLADQSVGVLQLSASVHLAEEDFEAVLGARPAVLRLRRNVTVRGGRPGVPSSYVLFDAGGVTDRVQLADGVWLVLEALVAYRYTDAIPSQTSRCSLLVPCRPGETGGLVLLDGAYLQEQACMPMPFRQTAIETTPRPLSFPGVQRGLFDVSQEGCVADPSEVLTEGVPLPDRCWAAKSLAVDYAINAERPDRQLKTTTSERYSILIRNCFQLCPLVLSVECVKQYGPYGCFMLTVGTQLNASQPRPRPRPQPRPGESQGLPRPLAAGGEPKPHERHQEPSSSSGGSGLLGPLLGGVLGGAALLALAAGLLLLVRRRNLQRDRSFASDSAVPCAGSPGSQKAAPAAAEPSTPRSTVMIELVEEGEQAGTEPQGLPRSVAAPRLQDSPRNPLPARMGSPATAAPSVASTPGSGATGLRRAVTVEDPITSSIPLTGLQLGVRVDGGSTPSASEQSCKEGEAQGGSGPHGRSGGTQQGAGSGGDPGARGASGQAPEQQGDDVQVQLLPETLGRGAYGSVQKGMYQGTMVAVKIVAEVGWPGQHPPPSSLLRSFEQEVQVLGRCRHPNVVRLLAACLTPPKLCLVMELMETSLHWLLHHSGTAPLPLHKVLHIAVEVARGLEYLHPTVMHRDLKPANVLLSDALSPRPVVKLADFGLSRLRNTAAATVNPEAGTASYIGPEAFDPSNYTITHQVDMYSLGVLLWEMLSGRQPWVGQNHVAIGMALVMLKQRLPLDLIPEERCPPRLRQLIALLWDGDPRRRPAAAEVVKVLTLAQQDLTHGSQGPPLSLLGSAASSAPPRSIATSSAQQPVSGALGSSAAGGALHAAGPRADDGAAAAAGGACAAGAGAAACAAAAAAAAAAPRAGDAGQGAQVRVLHAQGAQVRVLHAHQERLWQGGELADVDAGVGVGSTSAFRLPVTSSTRWDAALGLDSDLRPEPTAE